MIEETFFLHPPSWLKNPPNPAATRLFKRYVADAPGGTFPPNTSTYQGLYCMMPDGTYLAGKFARQDNATARRTLERGLAEWRQRTARSGTQVQPVPATPLDLYGGDPLQPGGIKLEVAYRDLPRGDDRRPGDWRFEDPHNLGWFDFSPEQARAFLTDSREPVAVPDDLFRKFACATLKDAVRGQMNGWEDDALTAGALHTQLVSASGSSRTFRLTGHALLDAGGRSYAPRLTGIATFDSARGAFTDFRLVAAGQRTGSGPANGRENDPGPAPMGVAFKLYPSSKR